MPAFEAEVFDVGAQGFGDTQPVEREQRRQGVVATTGQPGLDQERPELVAIKPDGP